MSSKTSERAKVRKGLIDKAIADGVSPFYPRGSSNFVLPMGKGKRALLVRADNSFTKEGEYWSSKTGKALPEGIDFRQKPVTEGASQFIDVRGKKTRIRTWDAGDNKWNYTTAGVRWATNKQIEVVVEIPTIIKGRNASTGKEWERVGWLPYELTDLAVGKIFVKEF